VVHWALTLQFHGGKRVIDDLRGRANTASGQHGELRVDMKNWGLFLPSNSTLRNYLPPVEVYSGFHPEVVKSFLSAYPSSSPRQVMVAWDEIEIRHGLIWNASTKELLGKASGPIAEKNAQSEDWPNMNNLLATHVTQFFLVSIDGAASVPIGFFPMVNINGEKVHKILKPLLELLRAGDDPLTVVATASDAFASNKTLLDLLRRHGEKIVHVFDPLHQEKNFRNNLWNKQISSKDKITFNLTLLDDLLQSSHGPTRRRFNQLHPSSPFPKDQMDLAPILKLLNPELISALKEREEPAVKAMAEYLQHMCLFHDATTDNEMDNDVRFQSLDRVVKYFQSLSGLTSGLVDQLCTTVESLKVLHDLSTKEETKFTFRVSVLGTIVVENFFSTVRSKCRYPNLWEYAVFARRAYFELIKNNAEDYLFIGPKKGQNQWKKYGNQIGMHFSIDQIKLLSKKEKVALTETKRAQNGGTADDESFCKAKGREYLCRRKRLTIREKTTKDSPFFSNRMKLEVRVRCPIPECIKVYVYEGFLANHLLQAHSKVLEEAQAMAHQAHQEAFRRALAARAEDHGGSPEVVTSIQVEADAPSLSAGDPEWLGMEEEEEELSVGVVQPRSIVTRPEDPTPEDIREFLTEQLDSGQQAWLDDEPIIVAAAPAFDIHLVPATPTAGEYFAIPPHLPPEDLPPAIELEDGQFVRVLVLDFEINNFKDLEPIELTVADILTGRTLTRLIKCENSIHFRAWQVHNISRRMLQHEPSFPAVEEELRDWLAFMGHSDEEVVVALAHNSAFDLRVLRRALDKAGRPFPNWVFHDTIQILRQHRPGLPSYALGKLADILECVNKPTHRSASDVRCLIEILHKVFGPSKEDVAKGVVNCVFGL
jgi:DNA polymerase III epsilon subunit-like protein